MIIITAFIKDGVVYRLDESSRQKLKRYESTTFVAPPGTRCLSKEDFFGTQWGLDHGYIPYEIESAGRRYHVKKYHRAVWDAWRATIKEVNDMIFKATNR